MATKKKTKTKTATKTATKRPIGKPGKGVGAKVGKRKRAARASAKPMAKKVKTLSSSVKPAEVKALATPKVPIKPGERPPDGRSFFEKSSWARERGWVQIVIWGPKSINEDAKKAAEKRGVSKSTFMREAIERALAALGIGKPLGSPVAPFEAVAKTRVVAKKKVAKVPSGQKRKVALKAAKRRDLRKARPKASPKSSGEPSSTAAAPRSAPSNTSLPGHGAGALSAPRPSSEGLPDRLDAISPDMLV